MVFWKDKIDKPLARLRKKEQRLSDHGLPVPWSSIVLGEELVKDIFPCLKGLVVPSKPWIFHTLSFFSCHSLQSSGLCWPPCDMVTRLAPRLQGFTLSLKLRSLLAETSQYMYIWISHWNEFRSVQWEAETLWQCLCLVESTDATWCPQEACLAPR